MTKSHTFVIAIAGLLTSTIGATAADQSGPSAGDEVQITEAIRSFFAAAMTNDLDKLCAVMLATSTPSMPEGVSPVMP